MVTETVKRERFKRWAEIRVTNAKAALRKVKQMSRKKQWSYTEAEAKAIVKALKKSVKEVEQGFAGTIETFQL